jgi:hypothetical protein
VNVVLLFGVANLRDCQLEEGRLMLQRSTSEAVARTQ